MKKILYTLIFLFSVFVVSAQLDRSIRPKAGPAPKIQLGEYEMFTLDNGLKVIVVENNKIPKVTYQLALDIDPILEKKQAGYVSFTGSLMRAGTTNRTKAEIDEAVDFIGASLSTRSNGISGSVLKKFSNDFLEIMADVLYNPSFPEDELVKLKTQNISGIQTAKNDANSIASNINKKITYGANHPYGEVLSESSIENIDIESCKKYYNTYFKPNIAYLVIVGDITLKEAKQQANQYFGKWQQAEVPELSYDFPKENKTPRVVIGNRDGAVQSVIMVSFPLDYKPGNPDAIKGSVMNSILGGGSLSSRINANLREDKAYTYGGYSSLSTDKLVGSFNASAEVKGIATDTAMYELLYEIERLKEEPVPETELETVKSRIAGSFARSLEQPATIARFALNIERYKLPKDYYETYLQKLSSVSVDDIQEMANKYLKPEKANIIAVGDISMLGKTMARFSKDGKVEEFDFYGNPVVKMDIPADITAEQVIANYIKAIGGKDKLMQVSDVVSNMGVSVQGMNIEIKNQQKAPNKIKVETKMGGNVLSTQICDGERGYMKSQMGNKEITGDELELMKIQSTLNAELYYNDLGVKAEVTDSEMVHGKAAWKVLLTMPSGKTSTDFYDQESGLKVKSITQQGGMSATAEYADYREVDGILFPFKTKQTAGPQVLDIEVKSIEINKGIDDSVFAIE